MCLSYRQLLQVYISTIEIRSMKMESQCVKSEGKTVADGTIGRGAHPKGWYVAQVHMKCEKKSAQRLEALGYETFVPVQSEIHQWSDRKKKIDRIVIPLSVFVRSDEVSVRVVERQPFVYRLLCAPGESRPARIPDDQIERFRFMLGNCDSEVTVEALEVKKGDAVRIVRGRLRGLEGFITEAEESKPKVSIVIDHIGCASVRIDKSDLEIIK